ncbi:MAG: toll/interleukin-1 receptor domain-containing protein [Acidobacteria bacterium]|nr:toll/interleukin-1 receptor domain-containing protein [Acidobacteriota bacterium]
MESEKKVFVSYSQDDSRFAQQLIRRLTEGGVPVWIDRYNILPAERWNDEIRRAISDASDYLVLVGTHPMAGPRLDNEWRALLSEVWANPQKKLIPVLMGEARVPPVWSNWQALRVDPLQENDSWTDRVLEALGQPQPEPKPTPEARLAHRQRLIEMGKDIEEMARRAGLPPVFSR